VTEGISRAERIADGHDHASVRTDYGAKKYVYKEDILRVSFL
jgi:hypothetical protein